MLLLFFVIYENSFIIILDFVFLLWEYLKAVLKFLKDNSPLLAALAAVSNLLLVFTFFRINKKDTENERKIARKSYWYRDVILNKNLDTLDKNFEEISRETKELRAEDCSEEGLRRAIDGYTSLKREILNTINNLIRIMDDEFADKLDDLLDDFEDFYIEKIEDILTSSEDSLEISKTNLIESITDHKNVYLLEVYTYEKNSYSLIKAD